MEQLQNLAAVSLNGSMKSVIVIHSYNGDTKDSIAPFIEKYCMEKNISYSFPIFPIRSDATYESWKMIMKSISLNKDSIVIAHSLGTKFILKYLLDTKIKIDTYISVAGFCDFKGREDLEHIIKDFEIDEYDYCKVIGNIKNRYSIYSDNDKMNSVQNCIKYADLLKAHKILIKGGNHFDPSSPIHHLTCIEEIIGE